MNELDACAPRSIAAGQPAGDGCFLNALTEALSSEQRQVVSAFYPASRRRFAPR